MKKLLAFLVVMIVFILIWIYFTESTSNFHSYIENGDLKTLETRFKPETLMDVHRDELIGDSTRTYLEPLTVYYPYLLLDVKYVDSREKTKKGTLLWSLVDGEMVLNTNNWEKSRGFAEAILSDVSPQQFFLLNELANNKNSLNKEKLQKNLNLEPGPFNALVESLKQKQLILVKGSEIRLHLADPYFNVLPTTNLDSELVFKSSYEGKKIGARFNRSKVERIAKAAFGPDFSIQNIEDVYLPVFRLGVQNPDGTVLYTDWNAITGEKMIF